MQLYTHVQSVYQDCNENVQYSISGLTYLRFLGNFGLNLRAYMVYILYLGWPTWPILSAHYCTVYVEYANHRQATILYCTVLYMCNVCIRCILDENLKENVDFTAHYVTAPMTLEITSKMAVDSFYSINSSSSLRKTIINSKSASKNSF